MRTPSIYSRPKLVDRASVCRVSLVYIHSRFQIWVLSISYSLTICIQVYVVTLSHAELCIIRYWPFPKCTHITVTVQNLLTTGVMDCSRANVVFLNASSAGM